MDVCKETVIEHFNTWQQRKVTAKNERLGLHKHYTASSTAYRLVRGGRKTPVRRHSTSKC